MVEELADSMLPSGIISLSGILSGSWWAGGVVGASSAPSVCGIKLQTGGGGGEGFTGTAGPGAVAPPGERAILCFLLDLVSMVGAAAAGFTARVCWA